MYQYYSRHFHHRFLRTLHIPTAVAILVIFLFVSSIGTLALASATANFTMVINPGTLAVNIVDEHFALVTHPSVDMGSVYQSSDCQTVKGTFGTNTQRIYIKNPDAADNGWVVTLSAANPSAHWQGNDGIFDFNDPTLGGCRDGDDRDSLGGQMFVNPSKSLIATGLCLVSCTGTGIIRGSPAFFSEGVVDSIVLLSASAGSSDVGDWFLQNLIVTQTIPPNQAPSPNYDLDLSLSITAN